MWVKNSDGKPDAMLTLSIVAFSVVILKVVFGGSLLSIFGWNIHIDPIAPDLAGVLLGTNTMGYVARRYTDKKFDSATLEPTGEEPQQ